MLSASQRLPGYRVAHILRKGYQCRTELYNVRFFANRYSQRDRFAVVVSKKIAKKAVDRNRIRRRMFESLRLTVKDRIVSGSEQAYDVVVIVKKNILEADFVSIHNLTKSLAGELEKIALKVRAK